LLRLGQRLAEANGRLETVNLRMKRDLDAAAQVQQSLLPRVLVRGRVVCRVAPESASSGEGPPGAATTLTATDLSRC
jgi:hypothetical protein